MPDLYRGVYREHHPDPGSAYGEKVIEHAESLAKSRAGLAGFICESILSCGGQIILPENYLQTAYAGIRKLGVCVSPMRYRLALVGWEKPFGDLNYRESFQISLLLENRSAMDILSQL